MSLVAANFRWFSAGRLCVGIEYGVFESKCVNLFKEINKMGCFAKLADTESRLAWKLLDVPLS